MTKEKLSANENTEVQQNADGKRKISLQVDLPDSNDLVVCKVCGLRTDTQSGNFNISYSLKKQALSISESNRLFF